MIVPMIQSKEQNQTNNAYWVALFAMCSTYTIIVPSIYLAAVMEEAAFYRFSIFFILSAILYTIGFQLIRTGSVQAGASLVIVVLPWGLIAPITQYQNVGVVSGLIAILGVWQISYLCLAKPRALYVTLYAITIGVFSIFADLYLLGPREISSEISLLIYGTTTAYILGIIFMLIRGYKFYSLRMKFITAVTALSVTGITITTIFVTLTLSRILTEDLGSDLQNLAQTESAALGGILESELRSLEVLRQNNALVQQVSLTNFTNREKTDDISSYLKEQDQLWKEALADNPSDLFILRRISSNTADELRKFQESFPEHTDLVLADSSGGLVAATDTIPDFYQADKTWWQEAVGSSGTGSIYIGSLANGDISGEYGIPISLPIYNGNGEVSGVLYAHYSLNALMNQVRRNINNEGVSTEVIVVIDDQGVITSEDGSYALEALGLGVAQIPYNQGYFTDQIQDTNYFASAESIRTNTDVAVIDRLNWGIIAIRESEEALSAIQSQQQVQIFTGALIVLIGSLAATIVGRTVANPILELAKMAQNVAAGEQQIRASIDTGDEIAILGQAFNGMAEKIDSNLIELQNRVDERTDALRASFQITRALSTIINEEDLLTTLIDQLSKNFNYYHVHVYIYDTSSQTLSLRSGSGKIGEQLLAENHQLPYGHGLIGQALISNTSVLASDVTNHAEWVPNTLLPNTKSELAVPISYGSQVIGVIDIQEDQVNALTAQDTELIQTIAIQTAIALRNASFYKEAQQRAERETLINLIREKIQETQDVDTALKTAVRELGQALNSKQTMVRMQTNKSNIQGFSHGD